ncbi:hypothetical protein M8C21_008764 [Ambrosia artemisiifolia]|uniref:Uncharacterized protein n=1 Tax=Ambrosia artemisiifolia TaxID=4212 RepID=A0AAD5D921_AMBAR|nr:hypothetical protein M8C21_008764 [Ambrosia artemisiifolia]
MIGEVAAVPRSLWLHVHPHIKTASLHSIHLSIPTNGTQFSEKIRIFSTKLSLQKLTIVTAAAAAASSVGNTDYAEEPATSVKFPTSLDLPGCSTSLSLIGTGFREKVFAIIGVKVHISTDGTPSAAEATIESANVTSSLFDVFFGRVPVSPTLKSSISNSLASFLK